MPAQLELTFDQPRASLATATAPVEALRFNGPAYDPERDNARLAGQMARIFNLMRDGEWRTLNEIATATNDPESSVSAQLRHLRKDRFGGHTVEREHRGDGGLHFYRLIVRSTNA